MHVVKWGVSIAKKARVISVGGPTRYVLVSQIKVTVRFRVKRKQASKQRNLFCS